MSFVRQGIQVNWRACLALTELIQRHRELTWEMTKREVTEKYAGQVFGFLWAVVHPAIQIAVYVFIFNVVFAVRVGGTVEMPADYTTYLLSGLVPWLMCAEALTKGTGILVSHSNLVKQVVFPLEVLPIKTVLASSFTLGISLVLLLMYVFATQGAVPWTVVLLPFVVAIQLIWLIGFCFVLSAIGAYFRDLRELVQVITTVGMYLIPIAYLPDMVPAMFRGAIYLNPFSYLIWCYQDIIYFGRLEHPIAWVVCPAIGVVSFVVGYRAFAKLKSMFGNVL